VGTLRTLVVLGSVSAPSWLGSCTLVKIYDDPEGPRYTGSYSSDHELAADEFTVATFNIEFGERVARATREIRENSELDAARVLLLQEVDPDGADQMARALGYDYVYYPGSVHHDRDFGNAVLSRWLIIDDAKLILPYRNPTNGRIRIAVRATLDTPGGPLVVFSVHSETLWLGPRARLEQARAIAADATRFEAPTVVGGDFNTLETAIVEETVELFERAGYAWATGEVPPSTESLIGDLRLDHLFVKGLEELGAKTQSTEASDHQPLWVKLRPAASP
jgi:endonuclease/exonuclease/phosphatase family metal-dependent hydrolase